MWLDRETDVRNRQGRSDVMADHALFIGWGEPVRGREAKGASVFGEAVALWTKFQSEKVIESWAAYFLGPHGGDLGGFFLLHGDREKLALARASEEMDRVVERAGMVVERLGVVPAFTGAAIESAMERFLADAAELS
jgi:hypothetical protein